MQCFIGAMAVRLLFYKKSGFLASLQYFVFLIDPNTNFTNNFGWFGW